MARIVITLEIDDRLIHKSNARFSLPQLITSRPAGGVSAVATDREVEAPAEEGAQVVESNGGFFGQLPVGLQLETTPAGDRFTAEVTARGIVVHGRGGENHLARTPSEAASIVHRLRGGSSNTSINGWWYWRGLDDGQWVPRDRFRRR
jgi:hypothetical protein